MFILLGFRTVDYVSKTGKKVHGWRLSFGEEREGWVGQDVFQEYVPMFKLPISPEELEVYVGAQVTPVYTRGGRLDRISFD